MSEIYNVLWQLIQNGNYQLESTLNRINVLYAAGQLSIGERAELLHQANSNASIDSERPEIQAQLESLMARVVMLEERVTVLESSSDSGSVSDTQEIPEWTTWDGMSANYQLGSVVKHNDRIWESVFSGQNVWEPGVVGDSFWVDITDQYQTSAAEA